MLNKQRFFQTHFDGRNFDIQMLVGKSLKIHFSTPDQRKIPLFVVIDTGAQD